MQPFMRKESPMEVDQIVAQWDMEEKAVRARMKASDVASPEQIAGRTGMEMFEAIFAGELPPPPVGDTLDIVGLHMDRHAVHRWRPRHRAGTRSALMGA
jgi:hypothetical protein